MQNTRWFLCAQCGRRVDEAEPTNGFQGCASLEIGPLGLMICRDCTAGILSVLGISPVELGEMMKRAMGETGDDSQLQL